MSPKLAKTQKALLLVAGSLLILVSSFTLLSPVDFYASSNIELGAACLAVLKFRRIPTWRCA